METATKLWSKSEVTVKKLAKKFHRKLHNRSCMGEEDLVQEGAVAFVRAYSRYKESYGASFNTYLTRVVCNHFCTLLKRSYVQNVDAYDIDEIEVGVRGSSFDRIYDADQMEVVLSRLSSGDVPVFACLVAPPIELDFMKAMDDANKDRSVEKISRRLIAEWLGKPKHEVNASVENIKATLRTLEIAPSGIRFRRVRSLGLPSYSYRMKANETDY